MQRTKVLGITFSDNLLADAKGIIEHAKVSAYRSVDYILVCRNWLLGKRIAEEELNTTDALIFQNKVSSLTS